MRYVVLLMSSVAAWSMTAGTAGAADFEPDYQPPPPRYDAPYAPPPVYNAPVAPPVYNAPYAPPPVYHAPPAPRSDYDARPYGGYYPPPRAAAEQCRTFVKPGIDEWGRQVFRRVRVCEEVIGAPPSYAPAPAGIYYDGYRTPRPPLDVGVEYVR